MKVLFSILFLSLALSLQSQTEQKQRCHQEEWLDQMEVTSPGYKQNINKSFSSFRKNKKSTNRINITIPVHVIIVHPTGQAIGTGSNFSLAHVQSQIDVLNQDFGRYNSDAGNTPSDFPAADTGIQFCLATVDPDGNPTDGITRYPFDGDFDGNAAAIRQETRWPREMYTNIWSAPNLPYLGLASVPTTFGLPSPNNDFIHVDAATFGGPGFGTQPNYNLGRTATHEMGHWLGLLHVWGNGDGGCGVDDNIDDTPLQEGSNFGCPNHPSPTCGNSGDMFMNYMDYVNDDCMNAFTQEQGEYMNTILSTSRASLNGSSFTACASSVPLVLSIVSQVDPSCTDSSDGYILVEAQGGIPDYSYSLNGGVPSANNLFSDLAGGTYTIEVFDSEGNSDIDMITLNTPLPLTADVLILESNACANQMDAAVQIQVAGGSNPYTYALNMGMTQNSNTFSNLATGFYVVNVVDNNGCTLDVDFEVTSTATIEITIDSTVNLLCHNDGMGIIMASAEGGNGPLSYSIDGINYQDSGEFANLDARDYLVYVRDSVGCHDSLATTLTEPDPFFLNVQSTDATCFDFNDGFVTVMAMGGNGGPFQYSFDSLNYGDTTMLDDLVAGDYNLYTLDSLGCLAIAAFNIEEPDEIQVIANTIINVTCFGHSDGMLSLSATGGNGGYTYILEGDSTTTAQYNNLEAGMYEVYVVDMNGCEGSAIFEVGVNSAIEISVSSQVPPTCFGYSDGSIQVTSGNTTGAVEYSLNEGVPQSSPVFDGLPAGDYEITVIDDFGCSAVISVSLGEPSLLSLEVGAINHVSCFGANDGSVIFIANGGTEPYTYSTNAQNLAPGDYSTIVTDANGCTSEMVDFTITEPEELVVDQVVVGDTPKNITVMASGGVEPFMYSFDGGVTFSDSNVTEEFGTGTITIIVRDANGCEVEATTFIDNVTEIAASWGIKTYPNPFQEEFLLALDFPKSTEAAIEIFDTNGRKVHYISTKKYNSGENFVKIDLSNFASSIYIVKIASAEGYRYIKTTKM